MAKRQVFFSFHYDNDHERAIQVQNMRKVDDSSTLFDNDGAEKKNQSNAEIEKWIEVQLNKRECLILLIGTQTADRKWIEYEIKKAYELEKGIVGIYIHKLEGKDGCQSSEGSNPLHNVLNKDGKRLSHFIEAFNSSYVSCDDVYNDIKNSIEHLVENAILRKGTY